MYIMYIDANTAGEGRVTAGDGGLILPGCVSCAGADEPGPQTLVWAGMRLTRTLGPFQVSEHTYRRTCSCPSNYIYKRNTKLIRTIDLKWTDGFLTIYSIKNMK